MSWLFGVVVGFILALTMLAHDIPSTRDKCRAAHPGFDCTLDWVVGERF